MQLKDKVVIITGGGRGLGKSFAENLAREGAKIVICSRSEDELSNTCEGISKAGGKCDYSIVDVTNASQVERFVDSVLSSYGRIDILINNSGYVTQRDSIENITDEEYVKYFHTNVDSVFYFLRKVIPIMKKYDDGFIINISSSAGKRANSLFPVYSATKFAVQAFTESVGKDLAGTNVRCIAVCPGGVNTAMRAKIFGDEDAKRQQSPEVIAGIVKDILIGKVIVPNGGDIEIRDGKVVAISDTLAGRR